MSSIEEGNRKALELQEEVWRNTKLWKANLAEAARILSEVLEKDPDNVTTLTNLGAALCDVGEPRASSKCSGHPPAQSHHTESQDRQR